MAVLSVIALHSFIVVHAGDTGRVDAEAEKLLLTGYLGVDLFFVLSGYLITTILDRTRDTDARMRTFYIRRVLRIFPLYYGFLLFAQIFLQRLGPYAVGTGSRAWDWVYLSNVGKAISGAMANGQMYGHFWSLSVEEHFYLVWPFIVFHTSRRTLTRICIGVFLASLIGYVILIMRGYEEIGYILTPTHLYSLASGAFVAIVQAENPAALRVWGRRIVHLAGWLLCAAVILSTVIDAATFRSLVTFITLFAFPAAVGVLALGEGGRLRAISSARWLRVVGRYSYAMYVLHLPIIFVLINSGLDMNRKIGGFYFPYRFMIGVVVAVLSFAAAFISWHVWEKQFLKLAPRYRPARSNVSNQGLVPA